MVRVKVSCNNHKYGILSKCLNLKGLGIFINEDLFLEDQAKLRKQIQKVNNARKEGNWEINRNRKAIIRDIDQNDNNK